MMDFHTHVLPGMDDGSRSVEESLEMLRRMAAAGTTHVAATPHFYAFQEPPDAFLARRAEAASILKEAMGGEAGLPEIRLGAEVRYYEAMSRTERLREMVIEGTGLLLVEMPFSPWTERMLYEVRELSENLRCTILIAHIERYLRYQRGQWFWHMLEDMGALVQSNASFFAGRLSRPRALRLLQAGRIHLLGSDCHNLDTRPPNLGMACDIISRRLGAGAVQQIAARGENILEPSSKRKDVFT